ncbi:MAG: hypothetical protein AAFP76_05970 [Bacteroidota bacterium]
MKKIAITMGIIMGSVFLYEGMAQEQSKAALQMKERLSQISSQKLVRHSVVINESHPRFKTLDELPESIRRNFVLRSETETAKVIQVDLENEKPHIRARNQYLMDRIMRTAKKQ